MLQPPVRFPHVIAEEVLMDMISIMEEWEEEELEV
jgi:hypothetical protein